jgi:hypothetical protein
MNATYIFDSAKRQVAKFPCQVPSFLPRRYASSSDSVDATEFDNIYRSNLDSHFLNLVCYALTLLSRLPRLLERLQ